jgi:putative endonuclease
VRTFHYFGLSYSYTVYAISSIERNYIYVGLSSELEERITRHQKGYGRTTRPYRPFKLIYTEEFSSRAKARLHEKNLKSGSGKEFLEGIQSIV